MKRLTLPWNKPEDNSSVCTVLLVRSREVSWDTSGLHTCQAPQEILGFLGPSASDLAGNHHQPRATIPTAQHWVCSFLVLACLRQCLPISGVRLSSVCTISVQRRDHGGVYGQLAATKQRQTLRDDFQAACVASVGRCDVEISEHNVRGHPGPSLSANLRDGISRCKSSSAKNPNCQKRRVDGHTDRCKQ